jgi:alcohol dehydrogenase (cytochrome c)
MLYIPIHPTCVKGTFSEVAREPHPTGDLYYYGNPRWTGWQSAGRLPHPKSPDHDGHLVAMDIETGEVRWRHSTRLRSLAAALTTAGGLVVTADGDRYLYVMDVETGDVLFRTRLPAPVQGFPITYAVDDRQYLAIPVGGGRMPGAPNAMYVFALPEHDSVP